MSLSEIAEQTPSPRSDCSRNENHPLTSTPLRGSTLARDILESSGDSSISPVHSTVSSSDCETISELDFSLLTEGVLNQLDQSEQGRESFGANSRPSGEHPPTTSALSGEHPPTTSPFSGELHPTTSPLSGEHPPTTSPFSGELPPTTSPLSGEHPPTTPLSGELHPTVNLGYKIVIDNIDKTVRPRHMRVDSQIKSLHYVQL